MTTKVEKFGDLLNYAPHISYRHFCPESFRCTLFGGNSRLPPRRFVSTFLVRTLAAKILSKATFQSKGRRPGSTLSLAVVESGIARGERWKGSRE
jgi:hypothetical protein